MGAVVTKEMLAAQLPMELRGSIAPDKMVRVVVEEVVDDDHGGAPDREALRRLLEESQNAAEGAGVSWEEAVGRVRTLRDEWERREPRPADDR